MGVEALRQDYRGLARYTLPEVTYEAFKTNHEMGRNRFISYYSLIFHCTSDIVAKKYLESVCLWNCTVAISTLVMIDSLRLKPMKTKTGVSLMTECMKAYCRYQDVPCQDQNRVVLKWHCAATDYIHTNYVGTPVSKKRFILTQGPLDGTINEFWQMVLQEEAETIIMLCSCIETVRVLSAEELTVMVCILNIKFTTADNATNQREVRHYQWLDWPDRGVPPCKLTSMELLSRVRGTTKPIVVHCSAGIGRTGTIVAIEYIMGALRS
ncbi:hypothetical protein KIN20_014449 [Parelaphostrongylus tenuis]|uniref:Protein-tyrosine phosphatase n=1 Tax=Parelaphostrongylus tenuis TaxID=148309 RepID=A0AAD5QRX6_PARTN|nr:hypothetical protein KIN20_014449 [Parelaphostrongylus tenuis]